MEKRRIQQQNESGSIPLNPSFNEDMQSGMRLPGLMRTKQTVFDKVSEKQDLIRHVQTLRG